MRLAAVMLLLLLPGGVARGQAAGSPTDRMLDLVAEARRSPCFIPPSRPPMLATIGAEVAAAAAAGDPAAMRRVGEAYLAEPGRARQALDWLERAAQGGDVAAAADAGSLYMTGRGTPRNEAAGAAWWLFGATRGDLRAMACLSAAHLLGRGVKQDLAEAARWAMAREMRAPGRLLLRPAAADYERTLPPRVLAEARRLALEVPEVTDPPGAGPPRWPPALGGPARMAAGGGG